MHFLTGFEQVLYLLNSLKSHTDSPRKLDVLSATQRMPLCYTSRVLAPPGSTQLGASASIQEATVDWELKTHILTYPQQWAKTIPFLCSKIQGTDVEIRCISHSHGMNKY